MNFGCCSLVQWWAGFRVSSGATYMPYNCTHAYAVNSSAHLSTYQLVWQWLVFCSVCTIPFNTMVRPADYLAPESWLFHCVSLCSSCMYVLQRELHLPHKTNIEHRILCCMQCMQFCEVPISWYDAQKFPWKWTCPPHFFFQKLSIGG
jgi:hypothetical protein